jgi:hypothetical protein
MLTYKKATKPEYKNFTNLQSRSQNLPRLTSFTQRFYTGDVSEEESIFHFVRPRDPPLLSEHLHGNRSEVGGGIN